MENVCSRGFKIWRILAVDLMFLQVGVHFGGSI